MARTQAYTLKGDTVRRIRVRKHHWRQEDLAEAANVSVTQLSRLESGIHTPQISTVERLAEALGVEFDDIVEWHV
jgi:transcriptional regulator with XRE-family HTH domain